MSEILIVIPVLDRPERAAAVYASATGATDVPHSFAFVISPGHRRQRHACEGTGAEVLEVPWQPGRGDWAKKINYAYLRHEHESVPWIFLGADDLCFCDGWASAALAVGEETGAGVVGTNDLGNPRVRAGQHSTHPLVRRSYVDALGTIDGLGVLCEEYDHQYADDELVETAKSRGAWAFARGAEVEHLHPYFGKAPMDETYEKAHRDTHADRALFERRRRLWEAG